MDQRRLTPIAAPCALAALGIGACAALWTTWLARPGEEWARVFLRGYAPAWVCYLLAAIVVTRARSLPRWALIWIVMLALGMRMIALAHTPELSTDVHRYLWDGRVSNAGVNPFAYAPDAPELRALRNGDWQQINFKEVPTLYPPFGQMLFAALARARDSDTEAFRWAFALFDLGSVLLLIALLRRTGRPAEGAIWYAWCPLPVTEVTGGAHLDSFALFMLLVALMVMARTDTKGSAVTGLALAGAVMAKGYAILTAPFFIRRGGWRLAMPCVIGCAVLLAPYAPVGNKLFAGLKYYLDGWETNSSAFLLLDWSLMRVTENHFSITRAISVGTVTMVIALLAWRLKPGLEPLLRASFLALGAQLLFGAPTLPWYSIWAVPALCWWRIPGLALFTLTASMQYYARWLYPSNDAAYHRLLWAGYLPVYALLIAQLSWWAASRRRSTSSHSSMNSMV